MADMDVVEILARVDAGATVTSQEWGYLLPELERRGVIHSDHVERCCCGRIFARAYKFRGQAFLWGASDQAWGQSGKMPSPAAACRVTPDMAPQILMFTTCGTCKRGWLLILDSPMSVKPV